jgi:pathogenesis-related protein 1
MKLSTLFFCAVCLTATLSSPSTAAAASGPHSVQSSTKVRLLVSNYSGRKVEIFWVDFNGGQQSFGKMPPQQPGEPPMSLNTFAGHVWMFVAQGRVLQTYTATAAGQQQVALGAAGGGGGVVQNPPPNVVNPPPVVPIVPKVFTPPPVVVNRDPGTVVNVGGARPPAEKAAFLKVHNDARAKVGVAPLQWSDALASYAQKWASQLAASGGFQHRDNSATGYGENLFGGSEGFTPADAASSWLEERASYHGGPVTPATASSVGHYTQMVWSSTTQVGYGIAHGRNGVVIVANYSPGGNFVGQKPY